MEKFTEQRKHTSAMVAFSGEVEFDHNDPNSAGLLGEKFTETSMNPNLKDRDLRTAFASEEYQVWKRMKSISITWCSATTGCRKSASRT